MSKIVKRPGDANDLRKRADEKLRKNSADVSQDSESLSGLQRLAHELRVHQIELEMQNEELRNAQLALETSVEKYRDLYDFAPVGYFTFSRDALITEVNLSGAALLGVERGKLLNTRFRRFVATRDAEVWDRHIINVFELGEPLSCELELTRGDGAGFFVRLASIRMVFHNGATVVRTAASDITARKKVEDALKIYADELIRSNRDLEQFAAVASHDLQEPLTTITGFLQLLNKRYAGKLDHDADTFISCAMDGVRRMGEMIGCLLEYSRITSAAKPFGLIDCNEVLKRVIATMNATITQTAAIVTSDPLPAVNGDANLLARVFQNLLSNGIKFHKKDAAPRIHISARRLTDAGHSDDAIDPFLAPTPKIWLFSVQDNGIGIDPKYHRHVFELFERLHSREEYPGTGIGLAICRKIIERHGGVMRLASTPGVGSTFYFTIPEKR